MNQDPAGKPAETRDFNKQPMTEEERRFLDVFSEVSGRTVTKMKEQRAWLELLLKHYKVQKQGHEMTDRDIAEYLYTESLGPSRRRSCTSAPTSTPEPESGLPNMGVTSPEKESRDSSPPESTSKSAESRTATSGALQERAVAASTGESKPEQQIPGEGFPPSARTGDSQLPFPSPSAALSDGPDNDLSEKPQGADTPSPAPENGTADSPADRPTPSTVRASDVPQVAEETPEPDQAETVPVQLDQAQLPTRKLYAGDQPAGGDPAHPSSGAARSEKAQAGSRPAAAPSDRDSSKATRPAPSPTVHGDKKTEPEPEALAERPKPQWKVIDPPRDDPDWVDHTAHERFDWKGRWTVLAGSVRGRLHAHKGLFRDDAYGIGTVDDWLILVVSDGAGSAPLARVGARLACDAAIEKLKTLLHAHTLKEDVGADAPLQSDLQRLRAFLVMAAGAAQNEILREAKKRSLARRDFNATLLLLVHTNWKNKGLFGAIQVGDGAIGILTDDNQCTLLGVADHGEFSSETRFLTTPDIEHEFESRALFTLKENVRAVAVMCDGVSDDFFPEHRRLVELFVGDPIAEMQTPEGESVRGLMHAVVPEPGPRGERLLEWLSYEKRQSSDDRTLLLMYRSDLT